MTIFEVAGNFGVGIHEGFGEIVYDSGTAGAVCADKGYVLTTFMRQSINHVLDNGGVFGLLDTVFGRSGSGGKINSEALQGRRIAKGKITGNAAAVDVFFAAHDEAI